jgi:uncharacterized protein YbaA (DUF1428 family)
MAYSIFHTTVNVHLDRLEMALMTWTTPPPCDDPATMSFDGRRMIYGGFATILDR